MLSSLLRYFCFNVHAITCNTEHILGRGGPALVAIASDFEARDHDVEVAVAMDLTLQTIEEQALEFGDLPASKAGHMDVITLGTTLVEVFFAFEMHQVKFVYKTVTLQKI